MEDLSNEERINLIKNEIIFLESECVRPMREHLLGINIDTNLKRLQRLNSKIEELRKTIH